MSSSAPTSPPTLPAPVSGLSPEELAERELQAMMDNSPVSSNGPQGLGEDNIEALDLDQPQAGGVTIASTFSSMSAASICQDLVVAHQKAAQLKLHPYQRDSVEEFVKVMSRFPHAVRFVFMVNLQASSMQRQILLFIQLCAVENQISSLKSAAAPFVSSLPLLVSILSLHFGFIFLIFFLLGKHQEFCHRSLAVIKAQCIQRCYTS